MKAIDRKDGCPVMARAPAASVSAEPTAVEPTAVEPEAPLETYVTVTASPARAILGLTQHPAHFWPQVETDVALLQNVRALLESRCPTPYIGGDGAAGFAPLGERLAAITPLFQRPTSAPFSLDEENAVRAYFADLRACLLQLDRVCKRYDTMAQDVQWDNPRSVTAFVLFRNAMACASKHALDFYQLAATNERLARMLDEASPMHGLPHRAMHELASVLASRAELARLKRMRLPLHEDAARTVASEARAALVMRLIADDPVAEDHLRICDHEEALAAALAQNARGRVRTSWFQEQVVKVGVEHLGPLLAHVKASRWMAKLMLPKDTPLQAKSFGAPLIGASEIAALKPKLAPGDIVFSRQDWYPSNFFKPKHWTHVFLHVGTPQEIAAAFDDDTEVRAYVRKRSLGRFERFSEYLADADRERWQRFNAADGAATPHRVIEAVGEGVTFNGDAALLQDHLGVLRPRLSKRDLAVAIERAFACEGLPYDNLFDMTKRDALVCSELMHNVFQPGGEMKQGLAMEAIRLSDWSGGMYTVLPGALVSVFQRQGDAPKKALDFVAYLQGDTATQSSRFASEAEFRESEELPTRSWQIPAAARALRKRVGSGSQTK